MINPQEIKKYLKVYFVVGLASLTTIGLSQITKPSYALLISTSQTTMTFSAAESFPQKDAVVPVQEVSSQMTEKPVVGVSDEQSKTEGVSQTEDPSVEPPLEQGNQITEVQLKGDKENSSSVYSDETSNVQSGMTTSDSHANEDQEQVGISGSTKISKEAESAINQTTIENTTTEGAISQSTHDQTTTSNAIGESEISQEMPEGALN